MHEGSVLYQMSVLQRRIFKLIHDKIFKEYSIHPGQIPMLFIIENRPGIIQREIAEIMDLEPGTVAVMLKRMEKNGLIERKEDEKDGRILKVYLTPKAQEVLKNVQKILSEIEAGISSMLSKEEQESLRFILGKLRNYLDEKIGQKDENCNYIKGE